MDGSTAHAVPAYIGASPEAAGTDDHGLICPFASQLHPDTEEVHRATLGWLVEQGLLQAHDASSRLATEDYTWLAGRMYPEADRACFQLIADFTSWIFGHDDLVDESVDRADPVGMGRLFDREFALMQGVATPDPDELNERALWDLARRLEAQAPDAVWFSRFALEFRNYLDGCLWEVQNRSEARSPSFGEYASLRPFAGAVWLYMEFVELVMGERLPFPVRQHRTVQRLRRCASDLASWHNDIYSVEKERRIGDPHNVVLVLQRDQGLSDRDALGEAVVRSNDRIAAFDSAAAAATELGDPVVGEYVRSLQWFVRGAFDYLLQSVRYAAFVPE